MPDSPATVKEIHVLQLFGVKARTEEVYRAMLALPSADIPELADLLGLSPGVVTEELDRLAELMLVVSGSAPGLSYLAVPPDQAIEVLIAREEERLRELQIQMERSRRDVTEFVESFVLNRSRRDDLGLVEQIDDAQVVRSRLFQLVRQAQQSVCFVLPGQALPTGAIEASTRLDDDLLARKISLRMIVTEASLATPHWSSHLAQQVAKGAQVRSHPAPSTRAIIVDQKVAVLPMTGASGGLVLHGADLVAPVAALFSEIWLNATPLAAGDEARPDEQISEARIRQVVTMLAQGQKDETIARRLGVSVRTVRRIVSAALLGLQAESRFQAGVIAVKRGWVD